MKVRLTILKILSPYRFRLIYVSLALVFVILSYENVWYIVVLVAFLLYILVHHTDLIRITILISSLFVASRYIMNQQTIDTTSAQSTLKVIESYYQDDYYVITGRKGLVLVKIYLTDGEEIKVGSTYQFSGEWKVPPSQTIPFGFDYQKYLLSKRTKYILYANEAVFVSKGVAISQLRDVTYSYIDNTIPKSKDYIKTFLLADKSDIDQSVIDGVNFMGISHMFAVSGYHIGLLVLAMTYLGKKSGVKIEYIEYAIVCILILYMVITAFSPSVVRASLLYIFLLINKRLHLDFSVFDILSCIFILVVLINPYIYYNIGFVLSFYITFVLLLSQPILRNKTRFQSLCMVSIIAFLSSFPLVLNMNTTINLMTLFYNVVFIYAMSFVILPLSYITFLFPLLDHYSSMIFSLFDHMIRFVSTIDWFVLNGFLDHPLWIIVFIGIIWYMFYTIEQHRFSYGSLVVLIVLFFTATNVHLMNPTSSISFVDINGDGIVIRDAYDRCNIIIDTGETDSYDSFIRYLHTKHIKRIDYLIISHFHSDHYGEADDIIQEFDVENVVTNQQVEAYENRLISCGSISMYIYPLPYEEENENNNSIILSVLLSNKHYLFTGDSEEERETKMMEYDFGDVDYLKVAHHGSITSSTELFLDHVRPIEAIISVYRDNRNDHPSPVVLSRFYERQIPVYRTDLLGTIEIRYWRQKEEKKYYTP